MTLAVLDGHFRLKLPSPEPRQLSRRRLDRLLGRFRQFFHHGPILEVNVPHALLNVFPLTRNGYSLVDHFLPAALWDEGIVSGSRLRVLIEAEYDCSRREVC